MEIKTVTLQGRAYAPVGERIKALHEEYPNAKLKTSYEFKEGYAIFKAVFTPDVEKPTRYFTGHSFGQVNKEKALEKLETVAVGRALAIGGFAPDGTIASAEEMEKFSE
jgi:hypothetical protein